MEEREEKNLESGFKIHNILLLESNFKRVENVVFGNPEIKQDIQINGEVTINPEKNIIAVIQTLRYSQIYNEIEQVSSTIKMVGTFEKVGESIINLEQFGHVNGAAIIYPFIREHLSNLSAKAGVGIILLPPVNFTKTNNSN